MRFRLSNVVALGALLLAGALLAASCSTRRVPTAVGDATSRPASAALRQALDAHDGASGALLEIPGVVGSGVAVDRTGRARVLVLLESGAVEGLPARIGGVPVEAVVTGAFRPFSLTGTYRPAPIGVSAGNANECLPGTLGCVLEAGPKRYVLSANHVLARQNQAAIGEAIVQPSRPDVDPACGPPPSSLTIARLADFQTIVYDGKTPNAMDAAIAEVEPGNLVDCATPDGFYGAPSAVVAAPVDGLAIMKVGRTTELTRGAIKAIDVRVKITFPAGTAVFENQVLTSPGFGAFGDSGSLVVTDDGTRRAVGIVIGGTNNGSAIVSPIGPILDRFHATICDH